MMWYNELTVIAIMAGMEYCMSNLPIGAVPKIWGDCLSVIFI